MWKVEKTGTKATRVKWTSCHDVNAFPDFIVLGQRSAIGTGRGDRPCAIKGWQPAAIVESVYVLVQCVSGLLKLQEDRLPSPRGDDNGDHSHPRLEARVWSYS